MKSKRPIRKKMIMLLVLLSLCLQLPAVETHDHEHHHHLNEIGISTGIVYMQPESETAPGLHLHFLRRLGDEGIKRFFGLGVGLEVIFSDHRHYNLMGTLAVFPWKKLVITFSPGLLMVKEDGENLHRLSFHCEITYEFELGSFEVGPFFGFSTAGGDTHFTIGFHLGRGF